MNNGPMQSSRRLKQSELSSSPKETVFLCHVHRESYCTVEVVVLANGSTSLHSRLSSSSFHLEPIISSLFHGMLDRPQQSLQTSIVSSDNDDRRSYVASTNTGRSQQTIPLRNHLLSLAVSQAWNMKHPRLGDECTVRNNAVYLLERSYHSSITSMVYESPSSECHFHVVTHRPKPRSPVEAPRFSSQYLSSPFMLYGKLISMSQAVLGSNPGSGDSNLSLLTFPYLSVFLLSWHSDPSSI